MSEYDSPDLDFKSRRVRREAERQAEKQVDALLPDVDPEVARIVLAGFLAAPEAHPCAVMAKLARAAVNEAVAFETLKAAFELVLCRERGHLAWERTTGADILHGARQDLTTESVRFGNNVWPMSVLAQGTPKRITVRIKPKENGEGGGVREIHFVGDLGDAALTPLGAADFGQAIFKALGGAVSGQAPVGATVVEKVQAPFDPRAPQKALGIPAADVTEMEWAADFDPFGGMLITPLDSPLDSTENVWRISADSNWIHRVSGTAGFPTKTAWTHRVEKHTGTQVVIGWNVGVIPDKSFTLSDLESEAEFPTVRYAADSVHPPSVIAPDE